MMNKNTVSTLVVATLLAAGFSASVSAHQAGDIIVRAGAVVVAPNESSDDVAGNGEFQISNNTQVGLNFGYMLTDNFGVELLAATPFSHDVSLAGVGKIAETKHLPPTLVAQYYFGDAQSKLRPYVGVGVNYTNFFDNEFTNDLNGALTDLSMSTSWGLAAQAGVDYQVNKNWLVNASVWYAQISSDVKFKLAGDTVVIDTDINPWVYMVSVGYTF
ncbi:MAG: outer membrane protein OmpW [Shewanella sp.]|uniref:outer membrane protein OmpW n=1 Tax=unclassified Shewanella TaxID=196818 RepID=UPI0021DA2F67|nr:MULTISPECIES: outer membrane protein OmpW [unclassified Shewanella]MCU8032958.1 outer membrane protein OmpW [Shewanella sp. SM71]MCU8094844.1 outer membrane protein OmpW [Shewanella sp. SM102]